MSAYGCSIPPDERYAPARKDDEPEIKILRNLQSLIPEWWELFRRCPDATPFQSPAWLMPWWSCFGKGEPIVVTATRNGQLCGLAVVYLYANNSCSQGRLFFIGKAVSDYLDILISPDEPRVQVAQRMFESLFEYLGLRHFVELDRLRPGSPVLQVKPVSGLRSIISGEGICPQLPLTGRTVQEFVKKKSTIINLRNRSRRAHALGTLEFVRADEDTYESLMKDLSKLHSARSNSAGRCGMFSDESMTRFLHQASRALLAAGMLRLHAMHLNGTSIAVSLGMLYGERAYLYNFGFDPGYSAIAPATHLIAFAMEQAAQEGAIIFDFLQGEEPYKFETWGAVPHYTYRVQYFFDSAQASNERADPRTNYQEIKMSPQSEKDKDERAPERKGDLAAHPDELGTDPAEVGLQSAGQDGSLQDVSALREATEESPEELAATGQALESNAVAGIEDAGDHPERPVHTHEEYGNPEDVPPQTRDDEAA